jgi:hypothetical protein
MRILPIHAIPIFLGTTLPGGVGAQLRAFDVFYKTPPVVGWQVIGSPELDCGVMGFVAQGEDNIEESIVGFTAEAPVADFIVGWQVSESPEPDEGVTGFIVEEEENPEKSVVGFTAESSELPDSVAGFIVEEDA